jgi:Xaa-Pro aminopeptidase
MAVVEQTVSLSEETVGRIQRELAARGLDGWLLFNFRGTNPVATKLLGLSPLMTRRYLVFIPRQGRPVAITHKIEQQPWTGWIGENRPYAGWQELEERLRELLGGVGKVAMEYSPGNAVPTVDYVPAGALELVRAAGPEVVSSAELVTTFYSPWSEADLESHRRSAQVLKETALQAFRRVGEAVRAGERITEYDVRRWVEGELVRRGVPIGAEAIVAVNANAANPHYAPTATQSSEIGEGDLLLIDLFGKENEDTVYADQTWMAYVGSEIPERIQRLWTTLRAAREAAIATLEGRWAAGEPVTGAEVHDAANDVLVRGGHAEHILHRTGHSIDRTLHGSGPNVDNLETRDIRQLVPGIGFSVEPGIYIAGDVGLRTEVDVFIGPDGPEVTPPGRQHDLFALLGAGVPG